ncbi:MAG TPA: SEC-C domain-containing protein [Acidimicrobiales bacterium]|nr:SEC-C domain-containing protein [Acidimicrobiales bacterium]
MDPDRLELLFGTAEPGIDPTDPDERAPLLAERFPGEPLARAITEVVAGQIVSNDPPEVWDAARRLLDAGFEAVRVMSQLRMALLSYMQSKWGGDASSPDPPRYEDLLAGLPLPESHEVEAALRGEAQASPGIAVDELRARAALRLGRDPGDRLVTALVDMVADHLTDPDGPLMLLAGDRVADAEALAAGVVLTHEVDDAEIGTDSLDLGVDLAGFERLEPTPPGLDEPLELFSIEPGYPGWHGPEGWLGAFSAGDVLAVRVAGGQLSLERLESKPPLERRVVDLLRASYEREAADDDLPVLVEDILANALLEDPDAFATPQAPLGDALEAAGLEIQGGYAAHDPAMWENRRRLQRTFRVFDELEDKKDRDAVLDLLAMIDGDGFDPARLARCGRAITEYELCDVVAHELVAHDSDGAGKAERFAERVGATRCRPELQAGARWLAALTSEEEGQTLVAEAHLHLAVEADPGWAPAVDRLAWYLFDRGRAAEAAALWRSLGLTAGDSQDLATAESFARTGKSKLGRNDPCWCGSGRKYKACHLGAAETAPLAERVGWLARKAAGFVERDEDAAEELWDLAAVRAGGSDRDSLRRALSDPLLVDVVLTEGGWFEQFLERRGPLLPDDEAILAQSWVLVDRSLYEVAEVRPGAGLTLVDLRSAERLDVAERSVSRQVVPGSVICARPVPDGGDGHQLVGAVFPVAAGREKDLLEVLDSGDPEAIVEWVAAAEAPPRVQTREGEDLVECRAELAFDDPDAARAFLDDAYEAEGDSTWTEMHDMGGGERILRAVLHLEGDRLSVETHSAERMDRVLSRLPAARVLSDERRPLAPGETPRPPAHLPQPADPDELAAVIRQIQDQMEARWCDEQVPALGGLTPRQAAADPSRRETLERLLLTLGDAPEGAFAMRPERIRRLLGM